jgi:CO dehydrogenase maturation factor
MTERMMPLSSNRIGILGKGGSGKSTVAVLLAKGLSRLGYEVCLLDADSTNIGLHQALGLDHPSLPLMDYFGGMVFSGGAVTCPVDDPTLLPGAEVNVSKLPEEYRARSPEGILFLTAGKIADQGPGAGCDGPVAKIARDLRLNGLGEYAVTVVDFKAGFEDSARGAITSLDWIVVVLDPTQASIKLAADMKAMVREIKAGVAPATQHLEIHRLAELARRLFREARIKDVLFVLNKVADEETEGYIRQKLGEAGIQPLGLVHQDPSIAAAWLKGNAIEGAEVSADGAWLAAALEVQEERVRAGSPALV